MKQFIKTYVPWLFSFGKSCYSFIRHQQTRRRVRGLITSGNPLYLELGAGDKKGVNGWQTVDVTKKCDLFWDLRKQLPLPSESVSKIYSSHFFEHLSFQETQKLLDECRRILIPGGVISVCVPNARLWIDAYLAPQEPDPSFYYAYTPAYHKTTRMDCLNYIAYMDGQHKYMFDKDNLPAVLSINGFKNARIREFDPALDMAERLTTSIYAEAEK